MTLPYKCQWVLDKKRAEYRTGCSHWAEGNYEKCPFCDREIEEVKDADN